MIPDATGELVWYRRIEVTVHIVVELQLAQVYKIAYSLSKLHLGIVIPKPS